MDANKKYLYFNTDSGDQDNARSFPVSSLVAIDIENNNNTQIKLLFKEAVQTDTIDIDLSRTTDGKDPRDFMEHLVNEINFGKDATIVVADDSLGEYVHPDINGVDAIDAATYSSPLIKLGSDIHVFREEATDPGAGFSASSYNFTTGSVGTINGEVITTLFIDLDGLTCAATGGKAIGINGSSNPAYITQITTAKNGIVSRGEMICVEVGTGAGSETTNQVDLVANTSGTIQPGGNVLSGTNDLLVDQNGAFTLGEVRNFDSSIITTDSSGDTILNPAGTIPAGGIQNRYLYLSLGTSSQTGGDFTSGKYIIRLYGAPTSNLNVIS
jgi:hypothetical protein